MAGRLWMRIRDHKSTIYLQKSEYVLPHVLDMGGGTRVSMEQHMDGDVLLVHVADAPDFCSEVAIVTTEGTTWSLTYVPNSDSPYIAKMISGGEGTPAARETLKAIGFEIREVADANGST